MKKNIECYEKLNPKGVPFPKNSLDKESVKKFVCQEKFEEMGKKADECAKQPKEEKEEEEKKVVECLKSFSSQ